ncbi:MAG TPA: APC family permease [Candidatus Nanoarchaeia archaeon]|nr:APC family permease [Candidatus Nanoarchaeia archaeon]
MTNQENPGLRWLYGAGIVGADIGTSVFYGTGILFPIVGYLAPAFVLGVCLLMWLFKATYEEGIAMNPHNGGAYSMALRSVGRRLAVLIGALTFVSYLATAAVSALSGSFYLSSLFDGFSTPLVVLFSFIPIFLFGFLNSKGIKDPARLVTIIVSAHFVLLIVIAIWGLVFLSIHFHEIDFTRMSTFVPGGTLTFAALAYGFAAAFLGITGFESAAQIVEELRHPLVKSIQKIYRLIVLLVSFTAPLISFLCLAILTQDEINSNINYLVSGLAQKLGGDILLVIIVIDATLTLYAAVNTAFVGFIGISTTMAKQGMLPEILLYRIDQRYPKMQGYPLIAVPFAIITMLLTAMVAGQLDIVATVYEVAFLGVMISFCACVILIRNKGMRKDTPLEHLSWAFSIGRKVIPISPLISAVILSFALGMLFTHSHADALLIMVLLFGIFLLWMIYYRWGNLERRLETRSDLRLGLGEFAHRSPLPDNLPKYVLCTSSTETKRLIVSALDSLIKKSNQKPFELVIFHAEDNKDPRGFFFDLLKGMVSQQIVPLYSNNNIIIKVKILPGNLVDGLSTLQKSYQFNSVIFGVGRNLHASKKLKEMIEKELEINVIHLNQDLNSYKALSG